MHSGVFRTGWSTLENIQAMPVIQLGVSLERSVFPSSSSLIHPPILDTHCPTLSSLNPPTHPYPQPKQSGHHQQPRTRLVGSRRTPPLCPQNCPGLVGLYLQLCPADTARGTRGGLASCQCHGPVAGALRPQVQAGPKLHVQDGELGSVVEEKNGARGMRGCM